jgi:HD-GYP domain-containing protein (c-di-GMP phosphodiesterase class II)
MNVISGSDFIPVKLDVLKSGMNINFSIFRENNGEFLLLCKDVVITDELLERFKKLTYPNYRIYLPSSHYESIIKDSPIPAIGPKRAAHFKNYEQAKERASKMFDTIVTKDSVPAEYTENLTQSIYKQVETVEISDIIEGINSVRNIDEYLHTHSVNVALLNGIIGRWLKLPEDELAVLVKIGLLHDIGKLKIPGGILNKPARLTESEFDMIMNHPIFSHELLMRSGINDERILKGVIQHHERVNGMGYPFGTGVSEITDYAKITAISDVYDAMVATRVYKEAHSPFEILSWFAEGCYSELDYKFVTVFLDSMAEEFRGKKVLLSDGREATVMFMHSFNIAYPIVKVGDEVVNTSPDIKCVSIIGE